MEVSAKTVKEAVEQALRQLRLDRSQVEIEVLNGGKSGILGWRGEDARVRVTPLSSPEPSAIPEAAPKVTAGAASETARETVEKLLSLIGVDANVQVSGTGTDESPWVVEVNDGDLGMLIGRRGQSLAALQYIVNFIVSQKLGSNARILVDVAGYRKRRQEELESLAQRVADLVKSSRKPITLEAMPASERRIIHLALKNEPGVTTGSIGLGDARKVVVSPR